MPRLKTVKTIQKVECKLNLTPQAKELLVNSAKQLKLNQNEIVENLILNFHSNTEIVKNSKYIIDREKLLQEIISRVETCFDFNKLLLSKIETQNERLETYENYLKNFENKFGEYRKKSRDLIEDNHNELKKIIEDLKPKSMFEKLKGN